MNSFISQFTQSKQGVEQNDMEFILFSHFHFFIGKMTRAVQILRYTFGWLIDIFIDSIDV